MSTEGERSDEPKYSLFIKCNPNIQTETDLTQTWLETDFAWHEWTRLTDSR